MPEFTPFFFLILFFGVSWLRKRIKFIKRMTEEQARPAARPSATPPPHFQEAAPVTLKRTAPAVRTAAQPAPKPREEKKQTPERKPLGEQEGQRLMGEPSWNEQTDEKYQPVKPAAPQKPRPVIVPQFTRSALVQAVVTKEILARPRSSWRPNRP